MPSKDKEMANFDFIVPQTSFPDNRCPNIIKDTRGIPYQYNYTDNNGNCHFSPIVGAKIRKRRTPSVPPCTPVDTVFQGIVTGELFGASTSFTFYLDAVSIGDFVFDTSIPELTGVLLPGYTLTVVAYVELPSGASRVTFTVTKTGSECELNGQVATIITESIDITGIASQIVTGVCCP